AAALRRRPGRAGLVRSAAGTRFLGRRDPPADGAGGPRAVAHHAQRRPRPGADRRVAAGTRRGRRAAGRTRRRGDRMTAEGRERRRALAAIALALLSALFFSQTYVLNRAISVDGGHWAWTASL